jgi:toxin ParE1/3/4
VAYRLSARAQEDLLGVAKYTQREFGRAQAERYLRELQEFCELLSCNPGMGRSYDPKNPLRFRVETASHVVFYRNDDVGLLVQRILHKSMEAKFHLFP